MTKLKDKIRTALDESRMLILGTQILLGFQFRGVFDKGFSHLPSTSQNLHLASLGILLIAIALIMWPGAYHRIVREGEDFTDVHDFTTRVMDIALFPFVVALTLEFYLITAKVLGMSGGIAFGSAAGATALLLLYGLGFLSRTRRWDSDANLREKSDKEEHVPRTELRDKIEQVLIETRVVLPGVQALLAFQFATMVVEGFDQLPASSKNIHLISLGLMGFTVILLMTPAAYHRIVERGENTEHFHRVASLLLLAAMIPLPLGICGDLFVVIRKVTGSVSLAIASALAMLLLFYGLWFGFTSYRRAHVTEA
jgi:Family of unknown function (DUF6328)